MEPLRQHVARLTGRMPSSSGASVLESWLFPYEELRHGLSGYVGSAPVYWLLSHLSLIALGDSPSPVGLRGDMIEFTGYRHKPGWTGGRMELYVRGGEPLFIERVTADAASAFFFQLDLIQRNEWVVEGVPVTLGGLWIAVESARQELEELRKSGRLPKQTSTNEILADLFTHWPRAHVVGGSCPPTWLTRCTRCPVQPVCCPMSRLGHTCEGCSILRTHGQRSRRW